ncbi:MAG: hypothetical protein KAW02_06255 [candidate division Zixibacteria bacterium]|nr:hypothetical protein [candidate division Zixibacteria bacterium]
MNRTATKIFLGLILFGFVLATPAYLGDAYARKHETKSLTKKIQLVGEKHLTVKMDIGAGIIDVGRNRTGDVLNAEVEYDPEEIRVDIDYHRIKDEGKLYLKSKSKHKGLNLDTEDNYWFLEFTDRIPISFEIDVGACEADFDFTGLRIDHLDMNLGASSVEVEFRKPNSERIHKINIDVGVSELTITGLGNANFDKLTFDGGVGDFTLDFSGEFEHRAYVDIDIGLGSLTILVPKDAGVQIKSESSFLSSFSIDKRDFDEVEDDLFESDNFGESEKELIFDIEVGLGSVEIEYIDR